MHPMHSLYPATDAPDAGGISRYRSGLRKRNRLVPHRISRSTGRLAPILLTCLAAFSGATAQEQGIALSYERAVALASDNRTVRIAEQGIELAEAQRQRMNALWFPQVAATGAYVHMSNRIEVRESLSAFTDPLKEFIHSLVPGEELISSLLDRIGSHSFGVPLAPADVTTIDLVATLPLITGGRRIYAGRIGRSLVGLAEVARQQVSADQQVLLAETYFGLRLGRSIVAVRRQTLEAFELHLRNALKLEANGMLTRTERLLFQVNRDEARRELEAAEKELELAQQALKTLVQLETEADLSPTTPLFIHESLPNPAFFRERASRQNYLLQGLDIRQQIQHNELRIANAAYIPTVGVFGKQTLYAHGIRKNLLPRTLVGVGLSWNLFDGLGREKKIRQARINDRILGIEREQATDELMLAVDRFYNQTRIALDNVAALRTTLGMSREIVRARQKSFLEGMATPTEVIDAELLLARVKVAMLTAFYQFDLGLANLLATSGMPDAFTHYVHTGRNEAAELDL